MQLCLQEEDNTASGFSKKQGPTQHCKSGPPFLQVSDVNINTCFGQPNYLAYNDEKPHPTSSQNQGCVHPSQLVDRGG